ncbi:unnamed protein product, partial [Staurois parvus]
ISPLSAPARCFVLLCITGQYKAAVLTVKHTPPPPNKTLPSHSLPFDRPSLLTPSCSVPLVQCQCFFFLALITVLMSLMMSVTPNHFPQCQNARRSP